MTMTLSTENKRLVLSGALLLTLGMSVWLGLGEAQDGIDVVEVAKPAARQSSAPRNAESQLFLPVMAEVRAAEQAKPRSGDMFKAHSWFIAPPPTLAVPLAQPVVALPTAPPLPFTYLGTVQDDGKTVVFLAKGQRLYTVHKGGVFDGQYRLEDESSDRIELVYLPLNVKQTLVIKGAS
jgi:hypothetical protein